MKSWFKHLILTTWVIATLTQAFQHADPAQAAIPVEYRPNYKIESQRNEIQDLLVKIQAAKNHPVRGW